MVHLLRHHVAASILIFFFISASWATADLKSAQRAGPFRIIRKMGRLDTEIQRRRLMGPGSSPPSCRSKCGHCGPCKPVHVAIKPGFSFPLEYYPEAWRCKCGNKLFMP